MKNQYKMRDEFEKQLLQSQFEAREDALSVLSKELHDNIGQLLNSAKLLVALTERNMHNPPETLVSAHETLGFAIQEIRELSKSLNKEWLQQFNLIENLQVEIERINKARITIISFNHPAVLHLSNEKQVILFRIIQECLQNALKHARAAAVNISIMHQATGLTIEIADNGVGFNWEERSNGMGIINMQHRVTLLNGAITWNTVPPSGTKVNIELPLEQPL